MCRRGQLGSEDGFFPHAMPTMSLRTPGAETCVCRCGAGERCVTVGYLQQWERAARRGSEWVLFVIRSKSGWETLPSDTNPKYSTC